MPPDTLRRPVAIAWHGLPAYAARAIKKTFATLESPMIVIGTPDVQSREYIANLVGREVIWINPKDPVRWSDLHLEPPAVFFYTGWAYKAFNSLAADTRRHGGSVICMVDNLRKFTFRQTLGKWYFQAAIRPNIDQFLVPGSAAQDLLKYFGVPEEKIHQGLYGADPDVFSPGPPLSERPNDFVFVGQFIPRKGIHCLIEAAQILRRSGKQFSFTAIGQGPLRQVLSDASFRVEEFSTSEAVAEWFKKSRFLILPSAEEHWGLVVHEAALCGCGLILSEAVGSRFEFGGHQNSWKFMPGNSQYLAQTMTLALQLDKQRLAECEAQSLTLAAGFGPQRWNSSVRNILQLCSMTCPALIPAADSLNEIEPVR